MIRHRTKKQVRTFDIFKLITAIILLLLILYTWRSRSGVASSGSAATPAASGPEQAPAAEQTPPPAAQVEAAATPTPEPQPAAETPTAAAEVPPVVAPALTLPPGELPAGEVALSGTGAPDSQLAIVVDGQTVTTATVGSDGTWQTTVDLPDAGEYEIRLRALDSAGTTLAESEPTTLQIEAGEAGTEAEAEATAPTLNLPAGDLAAGEVALSGEGEPGATVEIVVDGQTVSTATVGSDGNWQTTAELPDAGEYEVQLRAVDETGAALAESSPTTLRVGPAGAGAAAEGDLAAPTLTTPPGALAAEPVELSGTGEPGSELEILIDGQVVSTATVGSDGNWQTTAELPDAGQYEVRVRAVDDTGAVVSESSLATLQVGASEAGPAAEGEVAAPTLTMATGALAAGQVQLTGTGEPGATVEIVIDGQTVSAATVGSDGSWQTTAELPDTGEYEVQLRAVDETGAALAESSPTTLRVGPAGAGAAAEGDLAALTLITPTGVLTTGQVQLSGTGEPGSDLEILIDGQVVSTATVGGDGSWQTAVELPDAGQYEVEVQAVDDTGAALAASQPATLQIGEAEAETAPAADQGQPYIVQTDDWLSKIADKFYGDMFAYQAIIDATNARGAADTSFIPITDPNTIQVGQKLWIPAAPQ